MTGSESSDRDDAARAAAAATSAEEGFLLWRGLAWQVEGVICDRGLNLGHLIGTLYQFFERLGMGDKLRFKPAFNPYTEPSMEVPTPQRQPPNANPKLTSAPRPASAAHRWPTAVQRQRASRT